MSHIFAGDFNEWMAENSIWELAGPDITTHVMGSSLDKFLFLPGCQVPGTFFAPSREDEMKGGGEGTEVYYPAEVLPFQCVADRNPALLELPSTAGATPSSRHTLQVKNMAKEEWQTKNQALEEYIQGHAEHCERHEQENTATHMLRFIETAIKFVFKDNYAKKKKSDKK